MDKFLTKKAKPTGLVRLAENMAIALLIPVLLLWFCVAAWGYAEDGFVVEHVVMLLMALPFVLLLAYLFGRKRARKRAVTIAAALELAQGQSVDLMTLERSTGVKDVGQTIRMLTAKGILQQMVVMGNFVHTSEEYLRQMQVTCAYCGATLTNAGEPLNKCPHCGSPMRKY